MHKRYQMEWAALMLGNPLPLPKGPNHSHFIPAYVQQLRNARDKLNDGVAEDCLESHFSRAEAVWRSQVDPVERNKSREAVSHSESFERRWNQTLLEEAGSLVHEARMHSIGLASEIKKPMTESERRLYVYSAAMQRYGEQEGFERVNLKSLSYPLFSKKIATHWTLTWALKDPRFMTSFADHGIFWPNFFLSNGGRIARDIRQESYLSIPFDLVVHGFMGAYSKFTDLNELETILKAYFCLYRLVASVIETAISDVIRPADI